MGVDTWADRGDMYPLLIEVEWTPCFAPALLFSGVDIFCTACSDYIYIHRSFRLLVATPY